MHQPKIPLFILGGSDRQPAQLPPGGRGKHPLTGCKGVDVRIGGRCLVDILIERLEATGRFGPIYIAGPARAYEKAETSATLIDTDSGFGRNIQVGIELLLSRHPGGPLGICTCDILPDPTDLECVLEHYFANVPSDLWFPIVRTPQDPEALGASAWKPQYSVIPTGETGPVRVLPGHLTLFDPEALRLKFLYRLVDLGYRSRNRPIPYRRSYMLRQLLAAILTQDLLHVLRLRLPTFTWDVVRWGTVASRKLKDGVITQTELEDAARHIFIRRRHRKRFPSRRIQLPVLSALSLARDIDTQEEARALGASLPRLEGCRAQR